MNGSIFATAKTTFAPDLGKLAVPTEKGLDPRIDLGDPATKDHLVRSIATNGFHFLHVNSASNLNSGTPTIEFKIHSEYFPRATYEHAHRLLTAAAEEFNKPGTQKRYLINNLLTKLEAAGITLSSTTNFDPTLGIEKRTTADELKKAFSAQHIKLEQEVSSKKGEVVLHTEAGSVVFNLLGEAKTEGSTERLRVSITNILQIQADSPHDRGEALFKLMGRYVTSSGTNLIANIRGNGLAPDPKQPREINFVLAVPAPHRPHQVSGYSEPILLITQPLATTQPSRFSGLVTTLANLVGRSKS